MMNTNDVSDEVLNDYLEETQERLDRIASDLLEIESGAEIDLAGLKRELDTLKRLSGMTGFSDVENLCHLMGDYLEDRSDHELDEEMQALLDGCDFISVHVDAVTAGADIPTPPKTMLDRLRENMSHTPRASQESVVDLFPQAADPSSGATIENTTKDLDRPPARQMRYLIVDDNEPNRELLLDILSEHGDCDLTEDGPQAIDNFRRALECGQPYDAVFLDIMMPGMDGHVTLERIRRIEYQYALYGSAGVKVIMVTAAEGEQHMARAFRTGCQSYVTKPIGEAHLFAAMRRLKVICSN